MLHVLTHFVPTRRSADLHSPGQVVLVGIASDIDGLIAAHPALRRHLVPQRVAPIPKPELERLLLSCAGNARLSIDEDALDALASAAMGSPYHARLFGMSAALVTEAAARDRRSEEHTSELQSLMRISYAVFCLNKKKHKYYIQKHGAWQRL